MKILKIQFKNINNLKGENTISFEDEPLSSAGIFAITGPTGSGKSTILDVITLALFNKIPRFKGSVSKTSIVGLGSVVTHHMDDAYASITYEIHQRKYTSSWSVAKTRTGNFKDYEMFIYDEQGTPLDLKKSEVPGKNEAIIGLKYDQFVKSIILSQGQFSKFLKADKHERGQLLENLTGSTIYRKISIAAYEKYKTVKDEVALEKDRLENIVTLSDEERNQISNEIKSNENSKKSIDKILNDLNQERQIKLEFEKLSTALNNKQSEKDTLEQELLAFREKLSLLETYEKLDVLKIDLSKFDEGNKKFQKLSQEINNCNKSIEEKVLSRKEVMSEMAALTQKEITVDNFRSEMSAFEKEVNGLVQQIQFVGKRGKETRSTINAKAKNFNLEIDPKIDPGKAIPKLKEKIELGNNSIREADFDIDDDVEKLIAKSEVLKIEMDQLNEIKHANEHLEAAKSRVSKSSEELEVYTLNVKKYEPVVKVSQALVNTTKENISLLKKQENDARLIAKLSDHRKELVDGEPCPLCGAVHHPYADHGVNLDSNLRSSIEKAEAKLQQYETELESNNRLLTSNLSSRNLLLKQINTYKEEVETASKIQASKIQAYKGGSDISEEQLADSIEIIKLQSENLNKGIQAKQLNVILTDLIRDFETMDSILKEFQMLDKKLKQKYNGSDVSNDCNLLQDKFVQLSEGITNLKTLVNEKENESSEIKTYLSKVKPQLGEKVSKLGFDSVEKAIAFMISDIELSQLKNKKEQFNKRSSGLEAEIKSLKDDLSKNKALDKSHDKDLRSITESISAKTNEKEALIKSIGESTAILDKDSGERARMKSKEAQLTKLQEKLNKWALLNKLIGEKTGNKFANFAQGLTLQNLLVYANKRLQKLSDRYLLDKPIKDGALTVIDQYQGNIQRSVSTLSGGESFLISLALALSLSDMASRNVNLESLFIDEGFGTLDQESLDIAMNTLEKLQTESQKTVGVISHVEALKERIHVQIKLAKNAQGYGTLKIEG